MRHRLRLRRAEGVFWIATRRRPAGTGKTGPASRAGRGTVPGAILYLHRGSRTYRLYVPASAPDRPRGLVIMLHGCKQDPEDFAAGTGMNAVAETHGLAVAYPRQSGANNASSCWNCSDPSTRCATTGDPRSLQELRWRSCRNLASIAAESSWQAYQQGAQWRRSWARSIPIYSAAGIHSGLAYASANDVISAFSAMRGEGGLASSPKRLANGHRLRTIVFQGSADRTVHPSNADRIVAAATPTGAGWTVRKESGRSPSRTYARTIVVDTAGRPAVEYWLVDGAGHAWSGGHSAGSYTDPHGPDACSQMVRFFLDEQE
ncbi:extracellular catalytic domain type 1 short-chain-length polyhydroxyalkanoate depolymerase [Sinorhizobium numidicum]|uniref:extracellular catalytic domain type 1 short-chain-length polyhydroxyalkanoate depolymerase n=1 Tax=Sinorhizobium numidicum TaxID=680248 RepID=UPI003CC8587F